jgi:hypothetical protein
MQMKSPTSTEDESYIKLSDRVASHKKLGFSSQRPPVSKVTPPYILGASDAPRMKRIL